MVRKVRSLARAKSWGEEYDRGDAGEKVGSLLGKRVEGLKRDVVDIVDGWLLKIKGGVRCA